MSKQNGFTLIEIMIALMIGSLLVSGIVQVLVANKATYQVQDSMARMQENARFALDTMVRDIRQAGYDGCTPLPGSLINALIHAPEVFAPEIGMQGWEYTADGGTAPGSRYELTSTDSRPVKTNGNNAGWEGWVPSSGGNALDALPRVVPGSDIIRAWFPGTGSARVIDTNISSSLDVPSRITVNADHGIQSGDAILLSDCITSTLLQVCDINNNTDSAELIFSYSGKNCPLGNDISLLPETIFTNAEITPLSAATYFIGKQAGKPNNPPALYFATLSDKRKDGTTGIPMQLVEGVESLQITYGEDTDLDGLINQYVSADQVDDWRHIMAVKIAILMRTISQTGSYPQTTEFDVNGTRIKTSNEDKHIRKVFSTIIQIRNRG